MGTSRDYDESIREAREAIAQYLRNRKKTKVLERAALVFPNIRGAFFSRVSEEEEVYYSRARIDNTFRFVRAVHEAMQLPKAPRQTWDSFAERHKKLVSERYVTKGRAVWVCAVEHPGLSMLECLKALEMSARMRGVPFKESHYKDISNTRTMVKVIERILAEPDFEVNPISIANSLFPPRGYL